MFGGGSKAPGGLFGTPASTSAPAPAPSAPAAGLGLFGNTAASSAPSVASGSTTSPFGAAPAASKPGEAPTAPSISPFSKPAAPSTTVPADAKSTTTAGGAGTAAPAPAPAAAATSGLFGATPAPAAAAGGLFGAAPASTAATGGLFGAAPAPAAAAAAATGGLFGGAATTTAAPAAGAAAATPATPAPGTKATEPPAASRLKNKSLEEIINRWASDIEKYKGEFVKQSEHVKKWDTVLIENGDKLVDLLSKTIEAEKAQTRMDTVLLQLESEQEELATALDYYEGQIKTFCDSQLANNDGMQPADRERERTYSQAEKLNEMLIGMEGDLGEMIKAINKAGATINKTSNEDDPVCPLPLPCLPPYADVKCSSPKSSKS